MTENNQKQLCRVPHYLRSTDVLRWGEIQRNEIAMDDVTERWPQSDRLGRIV